MLETIIMDNRIELEKFTIFCILFLALSTSLGGAVESITGRRQSCSNEGEEVTLDAIQDFRCFKCICQNGFVECEPESCPAVDDCYMLEKRPVGGCCEKCKECFFNGQRYASGAEWVDPDCVAYKCVAGVITETTMQCYTPCSNPLPPSPGQCCPTCLGCYLNGQNVHDGREVTLTEDPCLKCHCSSKRLTCVKKACPILQCPISKQIKVPGECCPRCTERREIMQVPGRCILGKGFHADGKRFSPDHCSSCTCVNGTSVCQRSTCPVLECSPDYQKTNPGDCCPHCPPISEAEVRSTCTYDDKEYQNNETWNITPCRSCKCHGGEIRCAQTKCPKVKCRPNETLVTPEGQCCSKCVESAGICTVFGDPHYKTFDGKFYSFQGSCKYQLVSDCRDHSFSIRVTNDGVTTRSYSWTKTVTLKMGVTKVNLGQKLRVKVNGSKVTLPYDNSTGIQINRTLEGLLLTTEIGLQIEWDGHNFLQVQVPATFKNKLCGLCGNYNGIGRDDLTSRDGTNHSEQEVWRFANSWKVGGPKACSRKRENLAKRPNCKNRKGWAFCRPLREAEIFGDCNSRLNPANYFESCKMDMCECPTGMCYCESFAAYAHECQRLGGKLSNWREAVSCPVGLLTHSRQLQHSQHSHNRQLIANKSDRRAFDRRQQPGEHHQRNHLQQQLQQQQQRPRKRLRRPDYFNRNVPEALLIPKIPGRTPPPLH